MKIRNHYERIIGGTPDEQKVAAQELQSEFDENDPELDKDQVEKSPEELEIIEKTEAIVDKMVTKYGGDPKPLPLDNIYVLKPGSIPEDGAGVIKYFRLKIGIERKESKLLFARVLAHELFHLKSYKSAQVDRSGEADVYRSGLNLYDRKGSNKKYFDTLEEAIVAECTEKFFNEIKHDKAFEEEAEAMEKLNDWVVAYCRGEGWPEEKIKKYERELKYIPEAKNIVKGVLAYSDDEADRQAYATGLITALYKKGEVEMAERYSERQKMYGLFDKLIADSHGRFKNRDEVFTEFAKANFSGNYLPLARMVEDILGEGSFRKIAEEFSNDPNKEKTGITPK